MALIISLAFYCIYIVEYIKGCFLWVQGAMDLFDNDSGRPAFMRMREEVCLPNL